MSFKLGTWFECCFPKRINGEEFEKKIDVTINNSTLINHISPGIGVLEQKKNANGKNMEYNGNNTNGSNGIVNGNKHYYPNRQNNDMISKETASLTSTPKIQHRQMKLCAAIGTAIIGFDKFPMNELMEEERHYIPKDLNIQLKDIQSAPKGQIDNDIGDLLSTALTFNALGLIDNGRKEKDGIIIFGKIKQNDLMTIDYYLNFIENNYNQSHLFIVYYNTEQERYLIKFNVDEYSELAKNIYIKLSYNPIAGFPIKHKEIIVACNLVFHLLPYSNGILHVIDVQKKNKKHVFKPAKNSNEIAIVTIGRNEDCTLSFPEEKGLSKIHFQLCYIIEEKHWVLKDGSDKPTTNNNWLVGMNTYPLWDGFELEIYKKKLRFSLKQ